MVIIGFITARNAERMLASNQTDVGAEIEHLRNGGYVGRGMRMQLTPHGFRVQVSESALAGYYIEPAHLHPTPLERGITHFEQYSKLQAPAKPAAMQPTLPETVDEAEPKPPRYRYRLVRKRFKTWSAEDRPYDTAPRESMVFRCYTPKQGRRRVRNPEVPRRRPLPWYYEFRYGQLAELTELCQHKPVRGDTDMRYMPHEMVWDEEREYERPFFRGRMRQNEWKQSKKAAAHRQSRRKLNQAIRDALASGQVRHRLSLKQLTYMGMYGD